MNTKQANPVTARINDALKAAGLTQRLVRGRGYHYVTNVAVSSSLYISRLDAADYERARDHVNEVLRNVGVAFQIDNAPARAWQNDARTHHQSIQQLDEEARE